MKLILPNKILDQHIILLGKTRSGKSTVMRHFVEHLLSVKKRVCIIDPKGDWWGLKLSANGKSAGFPVIAFGDFKEPKVSDVPINSNSGKAVAELIVSGNRPCVIGLRGWMPGAQARFWIDFASTLFNSRQSGGLTVVIDEIQNFAPKERTGFDQENLALHWTKRLLSEGAGLGLTMINGSQRPQSVHNGVLTQCETLIAMRLVHDADCTAVEKWLKRTRDKDMRNEIMTSLPEMSRGEGWVWSPEIEFGPKRVEFPLFETFDSFAPPQLQKKFGKVWANVDIETVKAKLATVIEEARANNPAELKKEVARLQAELRKAPKASTVVEARNVPVLTPHERSRFTKLIGTLESIQLSLKDNDARMRSYAEELRLLFKDEIPFFKSKLGGLIEMGVIKLPPGNFSLSQKTQPPPPKPSVNPPKRVEPVEVGDLKITSKQQVILNALAWYESVGITPVTGPQVGAVALIDASGGHFSNVVGPLSSSGLITRNNGVMALTESGRAVAKIPDSVGTLSDYHEVLRQRIRRCRNANGKTVAILNVILDLNGAQQIDCAFIGDKAGIDHTGGHFSNTIGPLSTIGLITRSAGVVYPNNEILFPPGLS